MTTKEAFEEIRKISTVNNMEYPSDEEYKKAFYAIFEYNDGDVVLSERYAYTYETVCIGKTSNSDILDENTWRRKLKNAIHIESRTINDGKVYVRIKRKTTESEQLLYAAKAIYDKWKWNFVSRFDGLLNGIVKDNNPEVYNEGIMSKMAIDIYDSIPHLVRK